MLNWTTHLRTETGAVCRMVFWRLTGFRNHALQSTRRCGASIVNPADTKQFQPDRLSTVTLREAAETLPDDRVAAIAISNPRGASLRQPTVLLSTPNFSGPQRKT